MPQLICKDLAIGYSGDIITNSITFSVSKGDYLCVVGENGAGKSTLVKTLLGIIPPMSGSIEFSDGLRPNEIGYLPQQTAIQRDFPASVCEVVRSGLANRSGFRPFYNKRERDLANENMEQLGILSISDKCYRELSGGQQQRVLLARALCATRRLLLLDEPISGLDPHAARELYQLIHKLNRESDISIIMISHDVNVAIRDASHVLHLAGHPLYFGDREGYINSDVGRLFLRCEGGEKF